MATPDGRYVVSYNGEIYNFRELRAGARGARAPLPLAHATPRWCWTRWSQWGDGALLRFNGMFAFAVWDARTARLSARARPLRHQAACTIAAGRRRSLFGSEKKAILAHPALARELDREALLEYFTFQNFFTDRTLFAGVRLLPAGSCACGLGPRSGTTAPTRYWDYDFREPDRPADEREYVEELDRLSAGRVSRQLVTDVPRRLLPARRHGLGLDHRDRGAPAPVHEDLHRRLRPALGVRASNWASTSARRPSTCRTCSGPSTTRWC